MEPLIKFCKKMYKSSAFLLFFPKEHKKLGEILKKFENQYKESKK